MKIPKIFHRTWVGPNPIPDRLESYWQGWQANHPDWEFHTWDNDEIAAMDLVNKAEYDSTTLWAGKCDIAMHEILYRFGGIFLCSDMECFKNVEPLVDGLTAFAGRQDPITILGAFMGFPPEHWITKALVDGIPESFRLHQGGPHLPDIAGPRYLTRTLERELGVPQDQIDGRDDFVVIPACYVFPHLWTEPYLGPEAYPEAYCAHRWTGSWV